MTSNATTPHCPHGLWSHECAFCNPPPKPTCRHNYAPYDECPLCHAEVDAVREAMRESGQLKPPQEASGVGQWQRVREYANSPAPWSTLQNELRELLSAYDRLKAEVSKLKAEKLALFREAKAELAELRAENEKHRWRMLGAQVDPAIEALTQERDRLRAALERIERIQLSEAPADMTNIADRMRFVARKALEEICAHKPDAWAGERAKEALEQSGREVADKGEE